jgi:transketolase
MKMRPQFSQGIYDAMAKNSNIWVITSDLGYKMWDNIRAKYPQRFVNTGAAEQAMMGIAVGLALEGKIPIVYSITPFLLYRPFETIRNYLNNEQIPVKMISSGRNKEYDTEGFSHWSTDDRKVMKIFTNIISYWPTDTSSIPKLIDKMLKSSKPWYINLSKNL